MVIKKRLIALGQGLIALTIISTACLPEPVTTALVNRLDQQLNVSVSSFDEAEEKLQRILPQLRVEDNRVSDVAAAQYSPTAIVESLPPVDKFPRYGAQPTQDAETVYIEIFSSSEKSNGLKESERWLVDVAEAINARNLKVSSGQVIRVGIRRVPAGLAAQMIAAQTAKPAGFSPANALWVEWLTQQGVATDLATANLVPNQAGFVVSADTYQTLSEAKGEPDFEQVMGAILSGQLAVGYANPYVSTTGLNLLYTMFWHAAGHHRDGKPLTATDLQSPQVSSIFEAFQKQVVITTPTTPDLMQIFLRDPDKLQAFPLEYQDYVNLKQIPGFEETAYIPFGIPHSSPLVGFEWNTPAEREALQVLADVATSDNMQQLAASKGFEETAYLRRADLPPTPSGEVLREAQSFWKARKDGGRKVYMTLVIDNSGSMEGDRLEAVKSGLRVAVKHINAGNQIGLITFNDTAARRVDLAPLDTLQQQRLLAAIDQLDPNGGTAMYDGVLVGLSDLMAQMTRDPDGRYYLLLLTDGKANQGKTLSEIKGILEYSNVRIYPIAYGEVDENALEAIAALRESAVQVGTPENIEKLLKGVFQTGL